MNTNSPDITKKIALLEQELARLKSQLAPQKTVRVPEPFQAIFEEAEKTVSHYFSKLKFSPHEGTIQINDERYILVRASSLSNEFFENFASNLPERTQEEAFGVARDFLFDIGHLIGLEDAARFHQRMKLKDPISKLSAGPVHFAFSGWAFVDILPESDPSPDKNFFLKYHHPYSFEADSWIKAGKKSDKPVCIMNAAYSSGWCEESFNIPLTAVEICCRAKGDEHCTFIMAQPDEINRFLDREIAAGNSRPVEVPHFFERQLMEEKLVQDDKMLKTAQKIAKLGSWEYDTVSGRLTWSDELYNICEIDQDTVSNLGEEFLSKLNEEDIKIVKESFENCLKDGKSYRVEYEINLGMNRKKTLYALGMPHFNSDKEVVKIYGVTQDISESKRQNKILIENIREKETLLKEVHHRVKNNLQIISSLLNLQSSFIENEETLKSYRESQNRIKSIASVHELLYQSDGLARISFEKYLKKLVDDLIISYLGLKNRIKLFINTKEEFNIDTSIPLGLLINEIISNSLKHGLVNEPNEFIYIDIFKIRYKTYQLRIGDNGCGFDAPDPDQEPDSLGLMLIRELSEQLNGQIIKLNNDKGTHYELVFKSN